VPDVPGAALPAALVLVFQEQERGACEWPSALADLAGQKQEATPVAASELLRAQPAAAPGNSPFSQTRQLA